MSAALLVQLVIAGNAPAVGPTVCVTQLAGDLDAAVRSGQIAEGSVEERSIAWLSPIVAECVGGSCMKLADAMRERTPAFDSAAPHLVVSYGHSIECAIELYKQMCAGGTADACDALGNIYLFGSEPVPIDRDRALDFSTAGCRLRGDDNCGDVADGIRQHFYARHLVEVSGHFGYVGDGSDANATTPLGGEVGMLRLLGDWLPAEHKRNVVFGVGVGGQAEYANGRTRVGGTLSALLWTIKLRGGYIAELDGVEAGRRDIRLDLVLSAPWAQAPLRMLFRLDVPIESGPIDAGVRGGFLFELGWNFALDGRRPRLSDFGFPLGLL